MTDQTKRLYRSRNDQMIGGVCAGIADYFDIDPTLVRIIAAVLLLAGGTGFLAYIVAWIIIPEEPRELADSRESTDRPQNEAVEEIRDRAQQLATDIRNKVQEEKAAGNSNFLFGAILIGIGAIYLFKDLVPWFSLGKMWPVLLIVIGVAVLVKRDN